MMTVPLWLRLPGAFALSVLLGLAASALVLLAAHAPIVETFRAIFDGAVGSSSAIESSLVFAEPIAFTGLAAAIAFRARVWNIGGEGQMAMGAFGAALVALNFSLPAPLMLIAVVGCGLLCGAIWAFIPAALKIWLGVNEVLSSLMLNYIAILWVQSLVYGPWREPGGGWPFSAFFPDEARLPSIGSELDVCIIAAPLVALALGVLLRFSRWGFEINIVGRSHEAARYAAISVSRVTISVMLLSGALAGVAGVQQVSGAAGRLYVLTPGYGYLGILVSWLAGHDPLLVLVMSVFYGVLIQGGSALQIAQIDPSLVRVMQAAIILFALAGLTLARRAQPGAPRAKVERP
jgi:general nucleoside transport system permease protein